MSPVNRFWLLSMRGTCFMEIDSIPLSHLGHFIMFPFIENVLNEFLESSTINSIQLLVFLLKNINSVIRKSI